MVTAYAPQLIVPFAGCWHAKSRRLSTGTPGVGAADALGRALALALTPPDSDAVDVGEGGGVPEGVSERVAVRLDVEELVAVVEGERKEVSVFEALDEALEEALDEAVDEKPPSAHADTVEEALEEADSVAVAEEDAVRLAVGLGLGV